jgi:hypothetical protein
MPSTAAIAVVVAPSSRNSRRRHLDSLIFIRMSCFASDRMNQIGGAFGVRELTYSINRLAGVDCTAITRQ